MGRYAMRWRAIMRAEVKRRNRRIVFGVGAIGAAAFGVFVAWPW